MLLGVGDSAQVPEEVGDLDEENSLQSGSGAEVLFEFVQEGVEGGGAFALQGSVVGAKVGGIFDFSIVRAGVGQSHLGREIFATAQVNGTGVGRSRGGLAEFVAGNM